MEDNMKRCKIDLRNYQAIFSQIKKGAAVVNFDTEAEITIEYGFYCVDYYTVKRTYWQGGPFVEPYHEDTWERHTARFKNFNKALKLWSLVPETEVV